MEKEQIIKALECCASEENIYTACPIDEKIKDDCECGKFMARNALALIKELTEENKRIWSAFLGECNLSKCNREKEIKADIFQKIRFELTMYSGTYMNKSTIRLFDLYNLLDRVESEILNAGGTL